ncbi:MAG: pyrroline-5-carboxylate reductase [Janthinobacterium lividum]
MDVLFIGGGNMASALIGGLLARGAKAAQLCVVDPLPDARERISSSYSVRTAEVADDALLRAAEVIVLAVKPQQLKAVATALGSRVADALVLSIAAGISAVDLSRWLGDHQRLVRAMPNTPALIGKGITGAFAYSGTHGELPPADRARAARVLEAVGALIWCDSESQIDAITAISGSGPAYVFYFIEALEAAARQLGFDDAQARQLALTTFSGSVELAQASEESVAMLRQRVTSPGGTTAAALAAFEAHKVSAGIVSGALAAQQRAQQMAEEFGRAEG